MPNLYRKTPSLCAVIGLIASGELLAQDMLLLDCSPCRHPNVHPSDYGNFAYNAIRIPDNGFTYDQIDEMIVRNPLNQWAHVDLDFATYKLPIANIPVPFPNGDIDITVTDQNGNVTRYTIDHDLPRDLAVGYGIGPGYNPAAETAADGDDDSLASEFGEEGPGLEIIEPGVYNDDSLVDIGGGIGIPATGNYCGPGTDYICVY